jgi:hypothetical protein
LKAPVNTARKRPLIGENGENPGYSSEETRFNDALKRMLKTPPKPNDERRARVDKQPNDSKQAVKKRN